MLHTGCVCFLTLVPNEKALPGGSRPWSMLRRTAQRSGAPRLPLLPDVLPSPLRVFTGDGGSPPAPRRVDILLTKGI